MSLTRADAATYLAGRYGTLASAVGVGNADDADGWADAINDALLASAVDYPDLATATVEDADGRDFLALLRYAALRRLAEAASIQFSVTLPGGLAAQRGQVFAAINALLARAEAEVQRLGLLDGSTVEVLRVTTDFLEPAAWG